MVCKLNIVGLSVSKCYYNFILEKQASDASSVHDAL